MKSENIRIVRELADHLVQPSTRHLNSQWRRCSLHLNISNDRQLTTLWRSIYHLWKFNWKVLTYSKLKFISLLTLLVYPWSPPLKQAEPVGFLFHRIHLPSTEDLIHGTPEPSLLPVRHPQFFPSLLTYPGFECLQEHDLSFQNNLLLLFIPAQSREILPLPNNSISIPTDRN